MKRILALFAAALGSASLCSAATVAAWGFESPNVPPTVTGTTISGLLPDIGTGTATGMHASAATTFYSGVGNGSASSLRADNWAAGDYWEFQLSTLGFAHIQLSFDIATAPAGLATNFTLSYSLNGSSFTTYNSSVSSMTRTWSATKRDLPSNHSYDLTSRTALDNMPTVYFRLAENYPDLTTRAVSVDNFVVTATFIPEPSSVVLLGSAGVLVLLNQRFAGRHRIRTHRNT